MGWTGPMTERQYRANHAHLRWRYRDEGAGPDLAMAGLVPEETQKRWESKVSGVKFTMQEKIQARMVEVARAEREIANQRKAAAEKGGVTNQRN